MAKNLSRHQQKIVKSYYDNHDTIQTTKLSEIVTELWLATTEKKKAQLWQRAKTALDRLKVKPERVAKVVESQNAEALAKLVAELDAGKPDERR